MTKYSVSIVDGPQQQRLTRWYLQTLAELIEKGYGLGADVRHNLATWLRAVADGKDLRRVLGLQRRPKVDRPWWMGLDYLVRYKLTHKSEAAALEVADDWGVKSKTVMEAYGDRRAELDDELTYQLTPWRTAGSDTKAILEAWKLAIAGKRASIRRKKSAQIIRPAFRASRRKRA